MNNEVQNGPSSDGGSGKIGTWLLILIVLPVIYVLSTGPVVYVYSRYPGSGFETFLRYFYGPIKFINHPPLRRLLRHYINFFAK